MSSNSPGMQENMPEALHETLRLTMERAIEAYHQGRMDEAVLLCGEIARARPENFGAAYLLAAAHSARKEWDAALAALDRAIAIHPSHADAHDNRAVALLEIGRFSEAEASAVRAIDRDPTHARAFNNLGMARLALRRHDEALQSFGEALRHRPAFAEAHNNRGNVLQGLGRFEEALEAYDRAIEHKPDYAEAHNNRGAVLQELKRYPEAMKSFDLALEIRPDYPAACNNRGVTLVALDDYPASLEAFDRAISGNPDYADAWYNRANALKRMGRFDEAMQSYATALRINPAHAGALANAGMTELLRENFAEGWRMYEGRWKTRELAPLRARFAAPVWQGEEDIGGKRLLVYAEQGHGDTLQFCRYLPKLLGKCAQLAVEVQPSLLQLLKPSFTGVHFIAGGDALPDHDRTCPLMSLPLAFGTRLDTIPPVVPVHAAEDVVKEWSWILGQARVPRVGLAWRGSPRHSQDARRSLAFTELLGLLDLPLEFHCLHQEPMPPESENASIGCWGNQLRDFSDTAGLIHHMDLVISVDTAVAHVAATMGKPTWIILSPLPDFRWLLEREDSPWYPSVRLFRQAAEGGWRGVVERLREEIIRNFRIK